MQSSAAFAFAAVSGAALADEAATPIVFVHGDSDQGSIWQTTIWRFESNGFPRDRLAAISFTDPQARDADDAPQPNRSSTADELRELSAFVDAVKSRTGAAKVALVGNSRGGYAIRNYIANGGKQNVSRIVLCGAPNHGVFAADFNLGSEYNGKGAFLSKLNAGATEAPTDIPVLTLRSEGYDLYAQPDGVYLGHPGVATGVTSDGPALTGATNLVLGRVDHRETAFSPRAFAEIYAFLLGRAPGRLSIKPEDKITLGGIVTGMVGDTPTNRPVEGASLTVHAVDVESGARLGEPLWRQTTGADGAWGPLKFECPAAAEFELAVPGAPITHIYRSPFPRSLEILNLRPAPVLTDEDRKAGAIVMMTRPRGYFGVPRDYVRIDGQLPPGLPEGVPAVWKAKLKLDAFTDRPISAVFNEERIFVRPWPAQDNHITIAELTY
jgi:pimeloyl-ACP methyl ester carboxylesterase